MRIDSRELVTALTTPRPGTCLQGDSQGLTAPGGVEARETLPTDTRARGGEGRKRPSRLRPAGAADLEPSTAPARYGRVTSAGNTVIRLSRDTRSGHPEYVSESTTNQLNIVIR